jgi:hypothetical protein
MKRLYRGIWANKLENGEELPVGGSMFSNELTAKLILDFDFFEKDIIPYKSPEKMLDIHNKKEDEFYKWLNAVGSDIDPYLFFAASTVQNKVQDLLKVDLKNIPNHFERLSKVDKKDSKLSDLVGFSMCAEQAALGKYLLQYSLSKGYSSSFMEGVESGENLNLTDHSFIPIKDKEGNTYIFDIARPYSKQNLPRILKTDIPFDYNLFKNENNLLVGATEVLQGSRLYFGVGNPFLVQDPKIVDKIKS